MILGYSPVKLNGFNGKYKSGILGMRWQILKEVISSRDCGKPRANSKVASSQGQHTLPTQRIPGLSCELSRATLHESFIHVWKHQNLPLSFSNCHSLLSTDIHHLLWPRRVRTHKSRSSEITSDEIDDTKGKTAREGRSAPQIGR